MQTAAIALWLVSVMQWQSSSFGEPPAQTFWMLVVTPRDRQSVSLLRVYGTDISSHRAETGEPFSQAMHSSSFIWTARSSDFGQLLLGSRFGDVLQFKVENLHFVCSCCNRSNICLSEAFDLLTCSQISLHFITHQYITVHE